MFNALSRCDGISEYLILPCIEPGNEDVFNLAKAVDFAESRVKLNGRKLGITRNTYQAWSRGFKLSDFIIHMEDDTIPARDCLRYMEHCSRAYRHDATVFSVSAYNRSPCRPSQRYEVARRNPFNCWIVGIWKNRWNWIKNNWSLRPDAYALHLTSHLAKFNLAEIHPLLSRAQNIGVKNGTHIPSPEWHRQNQYTEHWAGRYNLPPGEYLERGWRRRQEKH
jgi:hypothetical protein